MQKLDDFLLRLFKNLIISASFFGISRYWVGIIYIILSNLACTSYCLSMRHGLTFMFSIYLPLWSICSAILSYQYLHDFISEYREDDIISSKPWYKSVLARFFLISTLMILYLIMYLANADHKLLAISCVIHPTFYFYINLNQGVRSKHTFKGILRWMTKKIKTALKPSPQPLPRPQPSPA